MKRIAIALCLLLAVAVAIAYAMSPMAVVGGSPEAAGGDGSNMRADDFEYANIAPLFAGGNLTQFIQPTHGLRATNATNSLYPWAWRGLVAAYSPGLGNTGNMLRDVSGFGNHGTLTNGPTWVVTPHGYALNFVVTNSQYVQMPVDSVDVLGSVTAMIRFRLTDTGTRTLLNIVNTGSEDTEYLTVFSRAGDNAVISYAGGGGGTGKATPTISAGIWYTLHTIKVGTSITNVFLDGIDVTTATTRTLDGATADFAIGKSSAALPFYAHCDIADVRIYNRVLTPAEIQQDFQNFKRRQTYLARR